MDQTPSNVSFQPQLFYDSVMKDISSKLHELFLGFSIEKHGVGGGGKYSQSNLIICIFCFLGSAEKVEK